MESVGDCKMDQKLRGKRKGKSACFNNIPKRKMKGLKYLYDSSQLSPQRPRANISFPENILKHHFQNYYEFL